MAFISQDLFLKVIVVVLIPSLCSSYPSSSQQRNKKDVACGYASCPSVDPNKINVHLVPHTHDDVGWLKTVDQYYYGSNTNYQRAGVQYILDSVLDALKENPERRFVFVETAFFWKWWIEQTPDIQQQVKDLVNEGRLEFIGGAWSANDEAVTHYQSTIDQFSWGLRKLNDTFGECGRPHIGWQIDAFGHSREMASIFGQMGFDGQFFARVDYQDKDNRINTKTLEMVWDGSDNLGEEADLFTCVLYNHYSAPAGFCFDVLCGDEPFIDNKDSGDYNVDQKVQDFVNFAQGQAQHYTTNNIIVLMGDDFNYMDALMYFKNIDKLIKYVNAADKGVNVMYSTPSCYLKAVNDIGNTYIKQSDDFMPLASDSHNFWSGFYTSRPALKYSERLANNFLQVTKQLEAMTKLGQAGDSPIDSLREALGVIQHHDAITGTEMQHVADDYLRTLSIGFDNAKASSSASLNQLLSDGTNNVEVQSCLKLNVSKCETTENEERFVVTMYNPLSHNISHFVRLPVQPGTYTVQDPQGTQQTIQMVPVPSEVLSDPEREGSPATHELVFKAENLPPLGFRSYYVTKVSSDFDGVQTSNDFFIGDTNFQIVLDESSGLVKTIVNGETEIPLAQNLYYYKSAANDAVSSAYMFRPDGEDPVEISSTAKITVYKGDVVEEIHQTFSDWATQIVRIYKQENHAEFEWLVGPIPTDDGIGKEVISRFTTNLVTDGVFYTDSNGRELIQRKKNFRPTFDVDIEEPVAANYYPITSRILIRDTTKGQEVAVINDRGQGGSSLNDGQVELMVHRRLVHPDGFGEPLNETAYGKGIYVRGHHYVIAGNINGNNPSLAAQEREITQRKLFLPWLFFSPGGSSFEDWQSSFKMEYNGITDSLPENIQILTLEPWKEQSLLLRFEHIMEENEDSELSKPVDITFEDIFSGFQVVSSRETTLAGNQWLEELNRLVWKTDNEKSHKTKTFNKSARAATLNPMEIKTYIIDVAKRT